MQFQPANTMRVMDNSGKIDGHLSRRISKPTPRSEVFSVMNVNTFLLDIHGLSYGSKPDMKVRAERLAEWFNTLANEDVPDVVVFNEVFSHAGSVMMQKLCNPSYQRVGDKDKNPIVECVEGRKFGFATKALKGSGCVKINGGIVIAVRAGLSMSDFHEEVFNQSCGGDWFSQKGFISVKVSGMKEAKGSTYGDVYVLGTHTQAWEVNRGVRETQFGQMWKHIDNHKSRYQKHPVVYAGDMNTESDEIEKMKELLHAKSSGFLDLGFWLPLRESTPWSTYAGGGRNAYLHFDLGESKAKSPHDQIAYVKDSPDYIQPSSMKWQYVPLKSEECWETRIASKKEDAIQIDDLSDHYAAYAELCFDRSGNKCQTQVLQGHRGYTRVGSTADGTTDEKRCCPGRGKIADKCFDWFTGGLKDTRIGFDPGTKYCTKTTYPYFGGRTTCAILDVRRSPPSLLEATDKEGCYRELAEIDLPFKQLACANKTEQLEARPLKGRLAINE